MGRVLEIGSCMPEGLMLDKELLFQSSAWRVETRKFEVGTWQNSGVCLQIMYFEELNCSEAGSELGI